MSDAKRAVLAVSLYFGYLAGFAWAVSVGRGYHFGLTLLIIVAMYALVLLTYACYRRTARKLGTARVKKSGVADDRLPFHKG